MSDQQLSFFDIVYNVRAMRRIKTDPVPLALMMKVLNAGVQAPSGQNLQPWKFVLISDEEKKTLVCPALHSGDRVQVQIQQRRPTSKTTR